jgi:hypothetical protein
MQVRFFQHEQQSERGLSGVSPIILRNRSSAGLSAESVRGWSVGGKWRLAATEISCSSRIFRLKTMCSCDAIINTLWVCRQTITETTVKQLKWMVSKMIFLRDISKTWSTFFLLSINRVPLVCFVKRFLSFLSVWTDVNRLHLVVYSLFMMCVLFFFSCRWIIK